MLNSKIKAFKKAAGRITVYCLFVLAAFFLQFNHVDAAQVLKKTSNLIGEPSVANNRVTFTLGNTVKYIQHAKYLSSDMKSPDDIGITKASTRITGFAYACPGYYTTRIYSDSSGKNLLGYIQVYVSEVDIKNSKCDPITVPNNTPEPTEQVPDPPVKVSPPAPKSNTHPIPEFEGVTSKPTSEKPKIAEKVVQPAPVTFNDYCVNSGHEKGFKYSKIPITKDFDGDECCPTEKIANVVGTTFDVIYINDVNNENYSIYKQPTTNSGWGCANYYGNITDTYCPADLDYNASTDTCDEVVVKGDIGSWSPKEEDYAGFLEVADFSEMGVYSLDPTDPTDPTEPTEPGGSEPDGESCEENPDQDHCPPPCYCEKLGEWGYLCCIFDCPGMDEFKSFIAFDAIGTASPPPVPDLPAPDIPNIFNILNDVDQRNPAKPTGQEDPGLGTSSFDANDIKNGAGEIPFREDPTGGFNIVNPLETLPEDGSTAPRPQEELETLPYPGGSGENLDGEGGVPKPSDSSDINGEINYPGEPGGQAKPPTTGGQAKPPTTGDIIKYPGA